MIYKIIFFLFMAIIDLLIVKSAFEVIAEEKTLWGYMFGATMIIWLLGQIVLLSKIF